MVTLRASLTSLSNTGGSPIFFSQALGDFFFFGFPAILYSQSFGLNPSILVFGFGRVRPCKSVCSTFFSFFVRCSPLTVTFAPVYNASPAGRYFVLLQLDI